MSDPAKGTRLAARPPMKHNRWLIFLMILVCVSLAPRARSEDPPSPVPANLAPSGGEYIPPPDEEVSADSSEMAPLFLVLGEQKIIKVDGLARFSAGGSVVRAHSMGNQLLIKGVSPGVSDIWVWKSDGSSEHRSIRVQKELGVGLKPGLERALGSLQEVEVLLSGTGALLRGTIHSTGEAARISALVAGFPADIQNETQLAESLLDSAQVRLQNWIVATKNQNRLVLERADDTLWVRGSIDRPSERAHVERQLHSIFPLLMTELESMPDNAPTVHFKVFLLELKKNHFHNLGLGWPASQPRAFQVTTSAIRDQIALDVALNALEGEGALKILSNPELVVRAPGDAELFAGGEIPVRAEGQFYSNIGWKAFGLSLKLKVTHTTATRVRLDVFTEVSHLDPSLSQDKIPGIQANRMKTQVDAQYGIPLFLSGLLQQSMHRVAQGLPLLRSIPILGALFGSEDYQNERSELIAILLPSTAPPAAPMGRMNWNAKQPWSLNQ